MEIFKIAMVGNPLGTDQERIIQEFSNKFNTDENKIVFVDVNNLSEQELLAEGAFNGLLYSTFNIDKHNPSLEKILKTQNNPDDLSIFATSLDAVTEQTMNAHNDFIVDFLGGKPSTPIFPVYISNENEIKAFTDGVIAPTATAYFNEVNSISSKTQEKTNSFVDIALNALEGKHAYTAGHVERVAKYTEALAKEAGFSEKEVNEAVLSARLHDIGKIGIPDNVLSANRSLDFIERLQMDYHSQLGEAYLQNLIAHNPSLKESLTPEVLQGIKNHHKHYDGYHDKYHQDPINGDAVGKYALTIAVADCIDAMTSQRAYNNPKHILDTFRDLWKEKGRQFSPEIAESAILMLGKQIGELGIDPTKMFALPYDNGKTYETDQNLKEFFEKHSDEIDIAKDPNPDKYTSLGFRLNEFGYLEFEEKNAPQWNKDIRVADEYAYQEREFARSMETSTDRLTVEQCQIVHDKVLAIFDAQDKEGKLALDRGRGLIKENIKNLSDEIFSAALGDSEYNEDTLKNVIEATIKSYTKQTEIEQNKDQSKDQGMSKE